MTELARKIYSRNTAVLGIPSFLNVPNTQLMPSQTLDGIPISTYATTDNNDPYPNPTNLATQYQQMYQYGSYVNREMLSRQQFNYYHPPMSSIPYIEDLAENYAATLQEDINRENEFQKVKARQLTPNENLEIIAQAARMQAQAGQ